MVLKDHKAPATPTELGNGVADRTMVELIQRLGDYHHKFQLMNTQRLWESFENGENLCYAAAFKTPEREKVAYFSPAMVIPPIALVIRKSDRQRIVGASPDMALTELIRNPALKGQLETVRSYGPTVDKILAGAPTPIPRELVSTPGALVRLVELGRLDYTLDYPMVALQYLASSAKTQTLEAIALTEAQEWPVNYIACTRNAWGQTAIRAIDVAIRKAAKSQNYRDALMRWLPTDYANRHRAHLNAYFDQRPNAPHQPN